MRIGLIGCGGIGRLRAEAARRLDGVQLRAVSDLDAARAAALGARSGAQVEPDWRALVRRADVDVVVVSTPPQVHAEMCIEALAQGKAVLCEKPLARTPAECLAVVEAAERAGRLLATGFNYRFYPSIRKARALLDSGIIGELDHIRSYAGYSARDHGQEWIHDVEVMGGGALRDNGIHLIDLTRYFLGEVEEVKGFATGRVWGFEGCEDNGFALLRSPAGRVATLHASWTEWRGYRLSVELYGDRGCIRATCFPMTTEVVWSAERGGRMRRRRHLFPLTFVGEHLRSYRWVVVQSFVEEFRGLERALRGEATPLASGVDGLRAVEIAHEAAGAAGGRARPAAAVGGGPGHINPGVSA